MYLAHIMFCYLKYWNIWQEKKKIELHGIVSNMVSCTDNTIFQEINNILCHAKNYYNIKHNFSKYIMIDLESCDRIDIIDCQSITNGNLIFWSFRLLWQLWELWHMEIFWGHVNWINNKICNANLNWNLYTTQRNLHLSKISLNQTWPNISAANKYYNV